MWTPTESISQHETFIIIIEDSSRKYSYGNNFYLNGWQKQTVIGHTQTVTEHKTETIIREHTTAAVVTQTVIQNHTTAAAVTQTIIQQHTTAAALTNTIIIVETHATEAPVTSTLIQLSTSIAAPVIIETAIVHTSILVNTPPPIAQTQVIAVTKTSVFQHVSNFTVTSVLAPMVHTVQLPPVIQTQQVAPIISTEILAPIVQTISQAPLFTTEFQQPIVKTILVTETPAPIVKSIFVAPLLVTQTQAPILITQTQAPVITTIIQAPQLVTSIPAPLLITEQLTSVQTQQFVSSAIQIIESHPGAVTLTQLFTEHSSFTQPPSTVTNTIISTEIHSSAVAINTPPPFVAPPFLNTTASVAILTTLAPIIASTTLQTSAVAQSSFVASFAASGTVIAAQPAFTGAAGKVNVALGGLWTVVGGIAVLVL